MNESHKSISRVKRKDGMKGDETMSSLHRKSEKKEWPLSQQKARCIVDKDFHSLLTYVHSYRTFNHYPFIQFIFKRKHFLYFSPSYTTTHSLKRAIFYLIICLHNYCTSTALINPVKRIFMS